jgi:SAM-dependent methyltransferase
VSTPVRCHLCSGPLRPLPEWIGAQITSDCRPWSGPGQHGVCESCGALQRAVDDGWRKQAEAIYAGYAVYAQADGLEQAVFDGAGAAQRRSERLLDRLAGGRALPADGTLLDVGCGNGSLLRAASARLPAWRLSGLEQDRRDLATLERIPGFARLFTGDLDALPSGFDLVTLIHVLEHVPAPRAFVQAVARRLGVGGLLLVEVPDVDANPFDLLIADHATHFSAPVLRRLLAGAGFEVLECRTDWVPREISLVARHGEGVPGDGDMHEGTREEAWALGRRHLAWLRALVKAAREGPDRVGVFGTSIGGTWLATELGDRVAFFVDEDPARIGRVHQGHPIRAPEDPDVVGPVWVPLPPAIARTVARRLVREGVEYHLLDSDGSPARVAADR